MQSSREMSENAGHARYWMLATFLVGLLVRIAGWISLKTAFFCGIPAFDDGVHWVRAFGIRNGAFPEAELPWGSPLYPYGTALISSLTDAGIPAVL
ncbi:MAG: hypothetical protein KAY24_15280, partial [Candidatus Eisenbacteria sp.]|nr:hypothetical protein [Candidatus Eisenbacteria bacterium]